MAKIGLGGGENQQTGDFPKAKLLVVDEDVSDICEYCGMLRQHGYDVCCVDSYAEGAACLDSGPVDMVIVSQGSPAFEGKRVLERAIEKDRHKPVLVLARSVDMNCYLEAMQLGACDYLEKPVSAGSLEEFVRTHLPP